MDIIEATARGDTQCSYNCEFIVTKKTYPALYKKLNKSTPRNQTATLLYYYI